MGEKVECVEIQQLYFSCLNPNFAPKLPSIKPNGKNDEEEEDDFFDGVVLCCESMTDSDISQCNSRLLVNKESMVAKTIKESMIKLGVVSADPDKSLLKKIEELDKR